MKFQRYVKILSFTRESDVERNGDDRMLISLLVESINTRNRYELNHMDIPLDDDGYVPLLKAFKNKEPIFLTIETSDDDEGAHLAE